VRAAAVQLESTVDRERNLGAAGRLVREAAADGAELVALPERVNVRGTSEDYLAHAETLEGPTVEWARDLARELGIDLVAGSFAERRPGREKLSNTSVHVGLDGELKAVYRKIHLFDVTVDEQEYRESDSDEAGREIVVSETAEGMPLGLTVCYDVRFPELYRILTLRGARVLTVPSNFTRTTGEAHWHALLRTRAIENQAFVLAPAQAGASPPDQPAYGHSLLVDPWGEVLAEAPGDGECFVAAELDLERQVEVRERLPSLANRVPDAYRWPAGPRAVAAGMSAA
jgi:deaminated glutathione amidase